MPRFFYLCNRNESPMRYIYIRVFIFSLFLSLGACSSDQNLEEVTSKYVNFSGKTMGTTYNITIEAESKTALKDDVDSILVAFNKEVSTYIPDATISRYNQAVDTFALRKSGAPHFFRNLVQSYRLHYLTNGYYDPTVMPLVNYWGFGYQARDTTQIGDSSIVDSLMQVVGLNRIGWEEAGDSLWLTKPGPGAQLDFSACAKGDGVDLIVQLFERKGYNNYMVEIGGEVFAKGQNPRGYSWTIGVNRPDPNSSRTDFIQKLNLVDQGLATSGNYRNFYEANGVTLSHTINPKTGWVERNKLLSTTVIANEVITADAWATALMVMGKDDAISVLEETEGITGFLVYAEGDTVGVYEAKDFSTTQSK